MTGYLAFSIYSYFASLISWRIEKLYRNQNNDKNIKIWLILKNIFRVTGTALLVAHLLS
jgi:hypothetical protein|tara:strand:- start:311 stop:487 length:177 start_codon:yes stop_codon:yes gene_type:complete